MLHHVELYVSDLGQSRDFYGFLLGGMGYQLYQEWECGFSYKKDSHYLVFVQAPDHSLDEGYHRCRIGLNHLAFSLGGPLDVDRWRQLFLDRGVPLLYEDRYPYASGSYYALYALDPDGIKIELVGE